MTSIMQIKPDVNINETLDLIIVPMLRAIIIPSNKLAIITTDLKKDAQSIILENGFTIGEYTDISFSPISAIPDLNYILADENTKKKYIETFRDFQLSFVSYIHQLAKKEPNKIRAQQLILTWECFTNRDVFALKKYSRVIDSSKPLTCLLLDELIIKYLVYFACWELAYVKDDIHKVLHNYFNLYANKIANDSYSSTYNTRIICSKRFEEIKDKFPKSKTLDYQVTLNMYSTIHKKIGIPQGMPDSKTEFFDKARPLKPKNENEENVKKVNKKRKKYYPLCNIVESSFLVDCSFSLSSKSANFLKKLFNYNINDESFDVIGGKLCDILLLATEAVTFNTIRFNTEISLKKDMDEKIFNYYCEKFLDCISDIMLVILPCIYGSYTDKSYKNVLLVYDYIKDELLNKRDSYIILGLNNWNDDKNYARRYISKRNKQINSDQAKITDYHKKLDNVKTKNSIQCLSQKERERYDAFENAINITQQYMTTLIRESLNKMKDDTI